MRKNIFLTGAPSSGKTTVVKRVIARLSIPAKGFYTEEVRIDDRRVGFLMNTLDGKKGYLAHEKIKGTLRVRRFGVSLANIEHIAVPSLAPVKSHVIILDEIARMECFSNKFRDAALRALDSQNPVIGTIAFGGDVFIKSIKDRADLELYEVTRENRDGLPDQILKEVHEIFMLRDKGV